MAIEIVREYLKKWDAQDRILEFPVSSATVELAAQAVGCEPARIAKTLSFLVPDAANDKESAAQGNLEAQGGEEEVPPRFAQRQVAPPISMRCAQGGAHAVLIVAAGDAKVDNSKYKQYFHTKAKMLHGEQVTELIGHAIGGVCPFGVKDGVEIFLDVSLKRFDTVFPAAGSSNSAIEVTMEELERFSGSSTWIDVCKGWQEE
ncbi:MAG: YbaK/EbsC family protein [Lachnospiraceae bacterium]|nr:YbaK/EbsC family protein [Lachnospiraceae bacterium]